MPYQPDSRDAAEKSANTEQDCWYRLVLSLGGTSAPPLTPMLNHLLMGCRRVPVNTGLSLQRDRGDQATAAGPASVHPSPINEEVNTRRECPAFKMSSKPGTRHTLREVETVSITGTEKCKMCSPSPAHSLPVTATKGKRWSCCSQASQGTRPGTRPNPRPRGGLITANQY